jgi:hypothetical protein
MGFGKKVKPASAIDFLRTVTPATGSGTVVAISFGGRCVGCSYRGNRFKRAARFILAHNRDNLYWTPNTVQDGINNTPKKRDITEMRWVHLDADDPSKETLDKIRNYRLPPSLIVFSGGGYNAYWKLKKPIPVNDDNVASLEAANVRVIQDLAPTDKGTQNINRILRLPGTRNVLNKKKRAEGRKPADAVLIEQHQDRSYTLEDFTDDDTASLTQEAVAANRNDGGKDTTKSAVLWKHVHEWVRKGVRDPDKLKALLADDPHLATLNATARKRQLDKVIGKALANEPAADDTERIDPEQHQKSLKTILEDKSLKVHWIIKGLFARGALPVISASPKVGKTTFIIGNLLHVKRQVPALGNFKAVKGTKDYAIGYFNEMGEINIRKAVKECKPGITDAEISKVLDTFIIYDQWPTLDAYGLERLEASINKHHFQLFVLDTIAAVRPVFKGLSASEADAKIMRQIAAIARRTNCCIIVVTQGNKRGGDIENITDRLAHTNQFAAAADDIITIYRKKNDDTHRRYLQLVGRNVQESDELILTLNHEGLGIEGRTYDIQMGETQRHIIDCLKTAKPTALTPNEIATRLTRRLGKHFKRENIKDCVGRMLKMQHLVRVSKGGHVTTPAIAAAHHVEWLDEVATERKVGAKVVSKVGAQAFSKGSSKGTRQGGQTYGG